MFNVIETSAPSIVAERHDAATKIAAQLAAAEAAIDAAISAVATLTAVMPMARAQAEVGMHVGQDALMHAMESCAQLVKSRTNIIRTHKALLTAQHEVGLGAVNFLGDCPETPAPQALTTTPRHLSLVAA